MKKLILIALAFAGVNAFAGTTTIGIKPVFEDPKCYGATTGKISLVVEGGNSPYYYSWSSDPSYHGASLTRLAAGTYTVTVYDAQADSGVYTIELSQPAQIIPTTEQLAGSGGGSNGAIGLTVSGGTPDYYFQWSNNATTQNIYNLTAGVYTVTVTDAFGCSATATQGVGTQGPVHENHTSDLFITNHTVELPVPGGNQPMNSKMDQLSGTDNTEATDNSIAMFPNPASDYVNMNMETATNAEITFYNAAGQVVMQKKTEGNQNRIDISTLAKGNYVVAINSDNGTVTKTISVIK